MFSKSMSSHSYRDIMHHYMSEANIKGCIIMVWQEAKLTKMSFQCVIILTSQTYMIIKLINKKIYHDDKKCPKYYKNAIKTFNYSISVSLVQSYCCSSGLPCGGMHMNIDTFTLLKIVNHGNHKERTKWLISYIFVSKIFQWAANHHFDRFKTCSFLHR